MHTSESPEVPLRAACESAWQSGIHLRSGKTISIPEPQPLLMRHITRTTDCGGQEAGSDSIPNVINLASGVSRSRQKVSLELPRRKRRREATATPNTRVTHAKGSGSSMTGMGNSTQSPGYVLIVELLLDAHAEMRQVYTPVVGRAHPFSAP